MANKKSSIFLEPDKSLLEQHLLFTKPDDEIEDLLLHPPRDQHSKPWTMIKPLPGFCVKLRKAAPDRGKVFINICKTDEIPAPEEISEVELMKILSSDEPSSYRVPMSIGEERDDLDKSGNPCAVFDIVVNTAFFKKVESGQLFRSFLITATLEALEDKYGLTLEKEEFVVLKGVKCKGGMTEHRIQVRSKPLVEVLPSGGYGESSCKNSSTKSGAAAGKKPLITEIHSRNIDTNQTEKSSHSASEPPYIIRWMDLEKNVMIAEFFLKDILLAKEIELDVGEDRILLQTTTKKYFLEIFLPHLINQEKTTAKFSVEKKVLTVVIQLAS